MVSSEWHQGYTFRFGLQIFPAGLQKHHKPGILLGGHPKEMKTEQVN